MSVTFTPTSPPAPLAAADAATAFRVVRAELAVPAATRLTGYSVRDLARDSAAAADPSVATDRDAVVVIVDPEIDAVFEAVVAMDEGFVRSLRRVSVAIFSRSPTWSVG